MNGAESLMRTAAGAGIELCFANPGTTEMHLVAALDAVPRIRAVLGLFEGVCTGAADGYGRMTGRPALTLLHLGPGFANGIANLHNARRARSPVVNLIGDHASWHLEHDAPLTSDIASLAGAVSSWVRASTSSKRLGEDLADAIAAAAGPPGQVASLIIPADHQWGEGAGPAPPRRPSALPAASSEAVDTAACRLRDASRSALLLGDGGLSERGQRAAGRIAQAAAGLRVYADTFPARWERGRGLPAVERLPYFPEQAIAALSEAEVVVLAGAREPVGFFGYEGIPSRLASPQALLKLAAPEEDVESALEAVADALGAPRAGAPPGSELPPPASGALTPASVGATLARALPEGAIVVDEAATTGLPFYAAAAAAPRHTLLTLTGGAIGQGPPCAAGAALACPERKVIAFQADGSAAYTAQALWTQAREGLDVVTVLCSNRAYRILQVELARAGVTEPGRQARALTDLRNPELDWVALARGFGVPATRVETAEELGAGLARTLAEPGPHLLELIV